MGPGALVAEQATGGCLCPLPNPAHAPHSWNLKGLEGNMKSPGSFGFVSITGWNGFVSGRDAAFHSGSLSQIQESYLIPPFSCLSHRQSMNEPCLLFLQCLFWLSPFLYVLIHPPCLLSHLDHYDTSCFDFTPFCQRAVGEIITKCGHTGQE